MKEVKKKLKKKYRHDTLWLIIQHINKHLTVCRCNRFRISYANRCRFATKEVRAYEFRVCASFLTKNLGISLNAQQHAIWERYYHRLRETEREKDEKKVARSQKMDRFEVYFRFILQINHHYVLATKHNYEKEKKQHNQEPDVESYSFCIWPLPNRALIKCHQRFCVNNVKVRLIKIKAWHSATMKNHAPSGTTHNIKNP